jgi:predicted nucleic acid-binding protein
VSVYLDASVLVALFTNDPFTRRADDFLRREMPTLAVSDFARAEFASAVSRRVRTGELTVDEAREAFSVLDVWTARAVRRITTSSADVAAATAYLRRLDLTLRTADALNIAIAERTGCTLLTFDRKMAESAQAIGLSIAAG